MEYRDILLREELLWFQKSRENWLVHGNRNTKFFHAQTIVRRHRNKIAGIFVDDIWCSDDVFMQREAIKFFKSLFCSSEACQPLSLAQVTALLLTPCSLITLLLLLLSRRS